MDINEQVVRKLLQEALQVRENAYAPYSSFQVGSALLDESGEIHVGCNVENAAYGPSNCAERTAIFRAIADGCTLGSFQAMAIVADTPQPVTPCGVCRQVLAECCRPNMPIIMGNLLSEGYVMSTVSELLPGAFRLEG